MIIGIDIGASITKGIVLEGLKITHKHNVKTQNLLDSAKSILKCLTSGIDLKNVNLVAVSGCGSRRIGNSLSGFSVEKVDEIQAIGRGGLVLAEQSKGLIVSVGTGTAMVVGFDGGKRVKHVGGTGIGGGTIMGLSRRLLGINNFLSLERMASKGNTCNVDLTIADILDGPIGILPAQATASNFGRLKEESSKEDVAAGIFNMVSQTIGVLASITAKAYNLETDLILVGGLIRSKLVGDIIVETAKLFGIRAYIPNDCEYCSAVGAARSVKVS